MSNTEPIPELRELVGGRFAAVCRECLRPSAPIPAASAADAWADLKRLGWHWFVSQHGGPGGARCFACTGKTADAAVRAAQKRRKRR